MRGPAQGTWLKPRIAAVFTRKRLELTAVLMLLTIAVTALPGGLTPHRIHFHVSDAEEVLDVVTAAAPDLVPGNARLSIDAIHRDGLAHRGAWMFAIDDQLRLLLLWRSPQMVTCPGSWSVAGEHAVAGESLSAAAARGLEEEVEFLGEAALQPLGRPYLFRHEYQTRKGLRIDLQWTRSFLAWSAVFAVDFSQISSGSPGSLVESIEAAAAEAAGNASAEAATSAAQAAAASTLENTRMVGLPMATVVRLALRSKSYFCNDEQRIWLFRSLAVAAAFLRARKPDRYKRYMADEWKMLEAEGLPVCCLSAEDGKAFDEINMDRCGVVCPDRAAAQGGNSTN
jgi:NUDIX domain